MNQNTETSSVMAEHEVELPGIRGRVTLTGPTLFGAGTLLVNGSPAVRATRNTYKLTREDGSLATARLLQSWTLTLPVVEVDGTKYFVGEKRPILYVVFSLLPLLLLFAGGALGGLCGGVGYAVNTQIGLSRWSGPVKLIAMLGVTLLASALYLVVVGALHALLVK
jgi:hypothetical protein